MKRWSPLKRITLALVGVASVCGALGTIWAFAGTAGAVAETQFPALGKTEFAQFTSKEEKRWNTMQESIAKTQNTVTGVLIQSCMTARQVAIGDLRRNRNDQDALQRLNNASACISKLTTGP